MLLGKKNKMCTYFKKPNNCIKPLSFQPSSPSELGCGECGELDLFIYTSLLFKKKMIHTRDRPIYSISVRICIKKPILKKEGKD